MLRTWKSRVIRHEVYATHYERIQSHLNQSCHTYQRVARHAGKGVMSRVRMEVCDMTHSHDLHSAFICVTWRMHTCAWHIHTRGIGCDMAHSHVLLYTLYDGVELRIFVACHAGEGVMSRVQPMCRYVTWCIHRCSHIHYTIESNCTSVWHVTQAKEAFHICDPRVDMWHDAFIRATIYTAWLSRIACISGIHPQSICVM